MNKTLKAADEVKKLHRMFQSLGEVVDVLDRIGSVEQAEQEARARVEAANREADAIKGTVDAAKAEAERLVEEAGVEAAAILADAEAKKQQAWADAERISDIASREAANVIADAEARRVAAENEAALARDSETVARSELADLEKKIEAARARIAKLLES